MDDDDTVDDDDSSMDDDDTTGDDDDSFVVADEACMASGCGVAYTCSEGAAFLPLALLPLWTRRRTR